MKRALLIGGLVVLAILAVWYITKKPENSRTPENYIGHSAEECSRIQVMCIEGFKRFDDASGCGCEPMPNQAR